MSFELPPCPLAALNLALSGSQYAAPMLKAREGRALRASSHRQPAVGMMTAASSTSAHAPNAQKQSSSTTHFPL